MKQIKILLFLALTMLMGGVIFQPIIANALSSIAGCVAGTAAPTASPTASPSPAFIVGAHFVASATPTVTIPSGGATPAAAGDCMVLVYDEGGSSAPAQCLTQTVGGANGFQPLMVGNAINWQTSHVQCEYLKVMTPQDIAAGSLTLVGVQNANPVCVAWFRHVTCATDGNGGTTTAGTSAAPQPASVTNTLAGDMDINMGVFNPASGTVTYSAAPSGYTNAVTQSGVASVNTGCWIDYKLLGAAGSIQPGTGTLSASNNWGAAHSMIQNLGGTQ